MCGIAEATLAIAIISAGASYMQAEQAADAEIEAQRRQDQVAYDNYQFNLSRTKKQREQILQEGGQQNMKAAIDRAKVEGQTKVAAGESGLGQFGLAGGAVDDVFGDIAFQTGVGKARVAGAVANRIEDSYATDEASYLNYKAKNSSFSPVMGGSIGNLLIDVASAGADYGTNPNRRYFKSTGSTPSTSSRGGSFPSPANSFTT